MRKNALTSQREHFSPHNCVPAVMMFQISRQDTKSVFANCLLFMTLDGGVDIDKADIVLTRDLVE